MMRLKQKYKKRKKNTKSQKSIMNKDICKDHRLSPGSLIFIHSVDDFIVLFLNFEFGGALGVHVQTLISPIWDCGCTSTLGRHEQIFIALIYMSVLLCILFLFFLYNIVISYNCVWKINYIKSNQM